MKQKKSLTATLASLSSISAFLHTKMNWSSQATSKSISTSTNTKPMSHSL